MRLFIAINLPESERARIAALIPSFEKITQSVRWLEPDTFHVTVKFLGDVADTDVPAVASALERAVSGLRAFQLHIGGIGAFPNAQRARVIWLGIGTSETLTRIHDRVDGAMSELGFDKETRPFAPHITLGKLRNNKTIDRGAMDQIAAAAVYKANIGVATVDVMRSHLGRTGAQYERLHSAKLQSGE